MSKYPPMVDWKGLKNLLGWPYSRTQTWRLMAEKIWVTEKRPGMRRGLAREIENPDRFPPCFKLSSHHNGRVVWRTADVLAYLEAHGLLLKDVD